MSGRRSEALKALQKRQRSAPPIQIAWIYAALGDNDQAFQWLEKAYREHVISLFWLKVDPRYDGLRSDRRYTALLKKMGLPI